MISELKLLIWAAAEVEPNFLTNSKLGVYRYHISCDMIPGESFGTITRTGEGTSTTNTQQKPQQQQHCCSFGQPCCATAVLLPTVQGRHDRCAVLKGVYAYYLHSSNIKHSRGRQAIPRSNSSRGSPHIHVGKIRRSRAAVYTNEGCSKILEARGPKLGVSLASLSSCVVHRQAYLRCFARPMSCELAL